MQSFCIPTFYLCIESLNVLIMSKMQEQKRKAVLAERARFESLCFQVKRGRCKLVPELREDNSLVNAELEKIREVGLTDDILALRDIVKGVEKDLGVLPESNKGSLIGTAVPFLLEIIENNPFDQDLQSSPLTELKELPFQVMIYYDNEIRNRVVDWIKSRYGTVTTRFGQPILKLSKTVIEIGRVVKA